jgi:hypothetical protein
LLFSTPISWSSTKKRTSLFGEAVCDHNLNLSSVWIANRLASAWKLFFLTSWGRFQGRFDNILDDLKRHEKQIDQEANAYNIAEAKFMRENLQEWRQESLAKVSQYEEEQTASQLQAICCWLKNNETDQSVIFDQVSSEGSKHPGTCSWLLKNSKISSWLRSHADNPFVWLRGNPGSGKSVIASQLVKFLNNKNSLVITHFCTYSYASSVQYDEVLKSLLFQMACSSGHLVAHIYGRHVVDKKSVSVLGLEQLLKTAITALSDDLGQDQIIYLIIDGLDEVAPEKQSRLINLMDRISRSHQPSGAACKILVATCATQLLKKCLGKKPTVSLSDEKENLRYAIGTYAEQRLKAQRHRFSELSLQDSDLVDIARQIGRKADGEHIAELISLESNYR